MKNRIALILLLYLAALFIGCTKPVKLEDSTNLLKSACGGKYTNEIPVDYYRNVINKLQKFWVLPDKGWDKNLNSVAILQILNNGTIGQVYLKKKSGNDEFDSYVIKSINMANPFPAFPTSDRPCLELGLTFTPGRKQ